MLEMSCLLWHVGLQSQAFYYIQLEGVAVDFGSEHFLVIVLDFHAVVFFVRCIMQF